MEEATIWLGGGGGSCSCSRAIGGIALKDQVKDLGTLAVVCVCVCVRVCVCVCVRVCVCVVGWGSCMPVQIQSL